MIISIIAAVAENGVIGNENKLIWHLPADMKFFKAKTTGHHIIMGRKTFESLGKRALPNRTTIVVSHQKDYDANGCLLASSLDEAIFLSDNDNEVFICGGSQIYKSALDIADKMYITHVHENFEGDAKFPDFDKEIWSQAEIENHDADDKNPFAYSFTTYTR